MAENITNPEIFYLDDSSDVVSNDGLDIDLANVDFVWGSPSLDYDSNSDHAARFYFDKSKYAFRAGKAANTDWDDVNVGSGSLALGDSVIASASLSNAIGAYLNASAASSAILGTGVDVSNRLANSTANSLYVGFNSTIPTFIVTGGSGAGTLGKVSIGNNASPNELLTLEGVMSFKETSAPSLTSGYGKLYVKSSDSKIYFLDDGGTEYDLTSGGGASASGVSGSVQFSDGAGGLDSDDTNLFYNSVSSKLGIRTNLPVGNLHVNAAASTYAGVFQSDQSNTLFTGTFASFNIVNSNATTNNHAVVSFSDVVGGSSSAGFGVRYVDRTNQYGDLYFYTKGTDGYKQRVYINYGGEVGIGTVSPTAQLHTVIGVSTTVGQIIKAATSQTANLQEWQNSSSTVLAHITSAGEFHNTGGGSDSLVLGAGANCDGDEPTCTSIGVNATCKGDGSVSIGYNSIAGDDSATTDRYNVAIGSLAEAIGSSGVAIGYNADSGDTSGSTAIGANSVVTGNSSIAIGSSASCTGAFGVAIGQGTTNTGSGVTVGRGASGSFAFGYNADSSGHSSAFALGSSANASGIGAIAIGHSSVASSSGSIAIGHSSSATDSQQLVIGGTYVGATHILDVYIGKGVTSTSPTNTTYHATGGSGTNIAGGDLIFAAGKATGNAASGEIHFQTSNETTSGSSLQTLTTKLYMDKDGQLVTSLDPNVGDYFVTSPNKLGLEATNSIWLKAPTINHPQSTEYTVSGTLTYTTGNQSTVFSNTNSTVSYGNYEALFSNNRIRSRYDITGNTSNDETSKLDIFNYTGTSSVSGTIAEVYTTRIGKQTLTHATTATTFTVASTLQLEDAPAAGTNVTLTEALALYVKSGNTRLNGTLGVGNNTPQSQLHVYVGNAGSDPAWTSNVDNLILESSGDNWTQLFQPAANTAGYSFSTPTNLNRAYMAYVGSSDHLVFGSGSNARMWIKNDGVVNIGDNSTPQNSLSQLEIQHTPADGTGADPTTLTLTNRRSSSWTDGAHMHRIDFYSRDSSGNGAGVKARIATMLGGTSGGGLGLDFGVDSGSGLISVFRYDKDTRFQVALASETGTGKFNVFTSATSQPAIYGQMKVGYENELVRITDGTNELFYIDNDKNMFLLGGILKFDSNETTGSGAESFSSTDYQKTVTFDYAMDDTNYVVAIEVGWQTSFWVTNKTVNGFTINVGSLHGQSSNQDVGWSIRPR